MTADKRIPFVHDCLDKPGTTAQLSPGLRVCRVTAPTGYCASQQGRSVEAFPGAVLPVPHLRVGFGAIDTRDVVAEPC